MLVTMKRKVFDSLDHAALEWTCVEPTLQRLHSGRDPTVKSQVLAQLTNGQKAQFLFRVLYHHTGNSVVDFYCWVSYLLTEARTWSGIKGGLRYFGDDAMLRLLEETESFLEAKNRLGDAEWRDVFPQDLDDDAELLASVSRLNATFHEIAPATLKLIGTYIRDNPGEFVRIDD
jgi:hypothetical protein